MNDAFFNPGVQFAGTELPLHLRMVVLIWFTFLGGAIGSFMNVVVYRLPRGRSLVSPGSRCPVCGHAIRMRHNVPVVGWLVLRGRCYDCRARIAARYPIVEAIMAAIFFALAWTGPLSAPLHGPLNGSETDRFNVLPWVQAGTFMILCSSLLSLALIELDDDADKETRFPRSLFWLPAAVGVSAPIVWPRPHRMDSLDWLPDIVAAAPPLAEFAVSLGGALSAALLLFAAGNAISSGPMGRAGRVYASASALLVGLYFGPQIAAAVISGATVIYLAAKTLALQALALRRFTWSLALCGTTFGYAVSPHWWEEQLAVGTPSPGGLAVHLLVALAVTAAASWGAARACSVCSTGSS